MTAPTLVTRTFEGVTVPAPGTFELDPLHTTVDFLAIERFPNLTFRSRLVEHASDNEFIAVGDLTIRDVTREVRLAVELEGVARSPWGKEVVGFTASTEIDREDFGITWNQALETGGVLVGKKVKIEITAEAIRLS